MNETLLTWIVFILAFAGMVLIHEFGHFIAARMSGIEVEEFGVGTTHAGSDHALGQQRIFDPEKRPENRNPFQFQASLCKFQ